ncbi:site-specific integrase (plasmid) [Halorubrum sp. BOL3-1]|uniref:tyrosine-type recombinase/integrase n=1 Tax=Halorubrum sp. BOL3-1 TaxID=2497325 RepID=UPI001004FF0A|nr:site-specific integrase [Halorubrum sp. BOL3-1]QAU11324.1 site-specific integrase [Halorubrum sp. BOL3-1]
MPDTPPKEKANIRYLKPAQVEAMRDAAYTGRHGDRDDAIVTLLYDTGLRRGELASVNRDMVDLDEAELRIPGGIQKHPPTGGTPDPVTFALDRSGELRTVRTLRAYFNDADLDDALFPSRKSDRMTGKGINDVVKRLADRAEVRPYHAAGRGGPDDVTAHTLRHSVAWRMLRAEEGNTIYDVRNRLRHSTVATTEQRYDHFQKV